VAQPRAEGFERHVAFDLGLIAVRILANTTLAMEVPRFTAALRRGRKIMLTSLLAKVNDKCNQCWLPYRKICIQNWGGSGKIDD
jgi:hypothetical protein